MSSQAAVAAGATLVAVAFALSTLERAVGGRKHHEVAWTIALVLFSVGASALWAGAAFGWGQWTFKTFYLTGAILNVPFLALGTVYLLAGENRGDRAFAVVALLAALCTGWILAAPLTASIDPSELPRGKEVFGPVPRIMAAVGSGVAAMALIGGAVWSAVRLLRGEGQRPGAPVPPSRLAAANALIAAGTLVLSAGGLLNSVLGEMDAFAVSLVVGIGVIFAGFLLTNPPGPRRELPEWLRDALEAPLDAPPAGSGSARLSPMR